MEGTPVEDPVDGPDDRPCVGGDRRECEQAHSRKPLAEAAGVQAALGGVDPEQVGTGRGVASVEQPLKGGDVGLRLVHA